MKILAVFAITAAALILLIKIAVPLGLSGWVVQGAAMLIIGGAFIYVLRSRH